MHPGNLEEAERWLAQARQDLDAARLLATGKYFNLACFHAQQSAEKAVKAFLYAKGADEPWGHSVNRLLEESSSFDDSLTSMATTGSLLDKFYVPTRYPNGLPGGTPAQAYDADEARRAIEWAGTIIAEMAKRVGSR